VAKQRFIEVKYKVKPGKRDEFFQKVQQLGIAKASRMEPGNYRYEYVIPTEDADVIFLFEVWGTEEQQKIHATTAHYKQLIELKKIYVEETEIKTTEIESMG